MLIKHATWTVGDKPAPLPLIKLATEQQNEEMIVADFRSVVQVRQVSFTT